jgi:hypothetical protein
MSAEVLTRQGRLELGVDGEYLDKVGNEKMATKLLVKTTDVTKAVSWRRTALMASVFSSSKCGLSHRAGERLARAHQRAQRRRDRTIVVRSATSFGGYV